MGLLPIPAPKLTQGASRAGFWRAAAKLRGLLVMGTSQFPSSTAG